MAATPKLRPRPLGIVIGSLPPGPTNGILDVAGVRVGHATVWFDEPAPPEGRGIARTGVTAIVPAPIGELLRAPMPVGVAVLNGAGELTGSWEAREWGTLHTPILLTRTMGVGRAYDGVVTAMLAADPAVGRDDVVIPMVGECDDSSLSDGRDVQVTADDVLVALEAARGAEAGPLEEGAVGAGTGMIAFGLKGGIGTASRVVDGHTVAALVLANFGDLDQLTVDGVPVGRQLVADGVRSASDAPAGSCIAVLATDAPLNPAQLTRIATRAGLGLARTGSVGQHGSGEIFAAFATTPRTADAPVHPDSEMNGLFAAAVEATEEAVISCLLAAETVTGHGGLTVHALDAVRLLEIMRANGRG